MNDRLQHGPIIVFDGDCVLCSCWVRFLLDRDPVEKFRFAAMQTDAGRQILAGAGLDPDDPSSFVLAVDGGVLRETTAIIAVLKRLNAPWPLLARFVALFPKAVRDWAYFRIARNRYRLFGKRAECYAPAPDEAWRFLR